MSFQVHKLPLLISVQIFCTFLLVVCSLLSSSHAKSCKCPGSDQDQLGNHSLSYTFDRMPGLLYLMNSYTVYTHLDSSIEYKFPKLNLSQEGWYILNHGFLLWDSSYESTDLHEASFSFVFTMSIYKPENQTVGNSSLVFAILPDGIWEYNYYNTSIGLHFPSNPTSRNVDHSRVSAQIISLANNETRAIFHLRGHSILIQIWVESLGAPSMENKYSIRIAYDHVGHRLYVYVDGGEGTPNPDTSPIVERFLNISAIMTPTVSLGFFSSLGQLLQLHTWNSTVDKLPADVEVPGSQGKTIILSSVLGSAAATIITAAVVYFYFTSKYRKWKKEQDKLAKAMQNLPGVPTQIDYAEIRKATKKFHDTMRLGKGGFGAVYRCTLPAAVSRTGQAMEVAVKKFMREVEDRRYNDFLAEVSIINRLRHKNIVPLVGWSYNKGEPLLVYEYMTNGSLDQHLFWRNDKGKRQQEAAIRHWDTRYGIVQDIATGLHYVHHEHEPMVLHRDIKASNIMLDSTFGARLGDFGMACTVAVDRSSVTGVAGTIGYIAPDYAISRKATRQSDIYAFGVLILEIATGKKYGDVPPDDGHITDWVWRLHQEGKLLEAVDRGAVTSGDNKQEDIVDEAKRLLLLGLACTNPNPSNRPSMVEVVQIITKLVPPPDVPLGKPTFVWPPEDWRMHNSMYSTTTSNWDRSSASTVDWVQSSRDLPPSASTREHSSDDP